MIQNLQMFFEPDSGGSDDDPRLTWINLTFQLHKPSDADTFGKDKKTRKIKSSILVDSTERVITKKIVDTILMNNHISRMDVIRVELSDDIYMIGDGVFRNYLSLNEVMWPDSLYAIGENAFRNCLSLGGTLSLPQGVVRIGDYAFYGCVFSEISLPMSTTAQNVSLARRNQYLCVSGSDISDNQRMLGETEEMFQDRGGPVGYTIESAVFCRNYSLKRVNLFVQTDIEFVLHNLRNAAFEGCHSIESINVCEVGSTVWHDARSPEVLARWFKDLPYSIMLNFLSIFNIQHPIIVLIRPDDGALYFNGLYEKISQWLTYDDINQLDSLMRRDRNQNSTQSYLIMDHLQPQKLPAVQIQTNAHVGTKQSLFNDPVNQILKWFA